MFFFRDGEVLRDVEAAERLEKLKEISSFHGVGRVPASSQSHLNSVCSAFFFLEALTTGRFGFIIKSVDPDITVLERKANGDRLGEDTRRGQTRTPTKCANLERVLSAVSTPEIHQTVREAGRLPTGKPFGALLLPAGPFPAHQPEGGLKTRPFESVSPFSGLCSFSCWGWSSLPPSPTSSLLQPLA